VSRRKYLVLLLGAFTVCMVLTLPVLVKPGSHVVPFGGGENGTEQNPEMTNGPDEAKLRVGLAVTEEEFTYWQQMNEQFMEQHPKVHVELTNYVEQDARTGWIREAQIGSANDLLLMDNTMIREFAVAGYLSPVDDLFTGLSLADHLEALTDPLKWNGYIWGLPIDCDPVMIVWQAELLRSVGGGLAPTDWNAFTALVTKLQNLDPALQALSIGSAEGSRVLTWLGAFSSDVASGKGASIANLAALGGQAVTQLQFWAEQVAGGATGLSEDRATWMNKLRSRQVLAAVMPWSEYRTIPSAERQLLQLSDSRNPLSWAGGRSLVLTSQSVEADAAKRWIEAMSAPDAQLLRYNKWGKLPARKSLYHGSVTELTRLDASPPSDLLKMLEKPLFKPDPGWTVKWEQWLDVWRGVQQGLVFNTEVVNQFVARWNSKQQSNDSSLAPPQKLEGSEKASEESVMKK